MLSGEDPWSMSSAGFQAQWEILKESIETLLTVPVSAYATVSYEKNYSACYKCVCHGYSEKLYDKLKSELTDRLVEVGSKLREFNDDLEFLKQFEQSWTQYNNALGGIVPIFTYLSRFYVEAKLNRILRTELLSLFDENVVDEHLTRLLTSLSNCPSRGPTVCDPAMVCTVVRGLFTLRPHCAADYPDLFQRHIPDSLPKTSIDELPSLQAEAQEMLMEARNAMEETPQPPSLPGSPGESGHEGGGFKDDNSMDFLEGAEGDDRDFESVFFTGKGRKRALCVCEEEMKTGGSDLSSVTKSFKKLSETEKGVQKEPEEEDEEGGFCRKTGALNLTKKS